MNVVKGSERVDEGVDHLVVGFVRRCPCGIVGIIVPRSRGHGLERDVTEETTQRGHITRSGDGSDDFLGGIEAKLPHGPCHGRIVMRRERLDIGFQRRHLLTFLHGWVSHTGGDDGMERVQEVILAGLDIGEAGVQGALVVTCSDLAPVDRVKNPSDPVAGGEDEHVRVWLVAVDGQVTAITP